MLISVTVRLLGCTVHVLSNRLFILYALGFHRASITAVDRYFTALAGLKFKPLRILSI